MDADLLAEGRGLRALIELKAAIAAMRQSGLQSGLQKRMLQLPINGTSKEVGA